MKKSAFFFACMIALVLLAAWTPQSEAFTQYSQNTDATNCQACHGDYRASPYISPTDDDSWGDDLHDVHRRIMLSSDCDACHGPNRFPVLLDSSSGGTGLDAIGCMGCHGRVEDGVGHYGAGLRQHHWNAGEQSCADCHDDADPANFTPVGEEILPVYYSASDTSHPAIPSDPCNPAADGFPEDYAASRLGLDNDGDGLYDGDDSDCPAPANTLPAAVNDAYTTDEDTPLNVTSPGVLDNDTDADSDPLTAGLKTGVSNGTLILNPDGSFTYTPNPDFFGTDIFTYVANDGIDDSSTATVTITVTAVNDPPVSDPNGAYIGTVGSDVSFDGSISYDIDGTIVSYVWDFGDGSTGTGDSPIHKYAGPALFDVTLTVTDDGGATDTAATTAEISAVPNTRPVAVNDAYTMDEDTVLNVAIPGVLANDTDGDGDPLNAILTADVSNGTLITLNLDGSFSYMPNVNFSGSDTFTYVASDGMDDSIIATVTITVNPVNDQPVSDPNGPYSGTAGSPVSFDGSGSSDVDGTIATYVWNFGDGNTGTGINPINIYSAAGTFAVTLTVTDDGGATDIAETTAVISDVPNSPPAVVEDAYTTDEDTPLTVVAPGILTNDMDADGDTLTTILNSDVSNGILSLNTDGSFNYMPDVNFSGLNTFTYVANDSMADSNIATVTITVNPVNDRPMAVDNNYTIPRDTVLTVAAPGVLGNDSDPEGDSLTASLITNVANGTLTLETGGAFIYRPIAGFTGPDNFTYVANDGALDSNTATVIITVQAGANKPPVAVNDTTATPEETPVTIDVLANDTDPDSDPLKIVEVSVPANGTTVDNGDDTVTYTPNANFIGTDSFTYTIEDGQGDSSTATVTMEVTPVNDPPVANDDAYSMSQNTILTMAAPGVLGNDIDPDGDALMVSLISDVFNGFLSLNNDGSFDYTPDPEFTGSDTFSYVASDGLIDSSEATVTVTVQPVEVPVCDDGSVVVIAEIEYNQGDEKLHIKGWATTGETITIINADTSEILEEGIRVREDKWEAEFGGVGSDLETITVVTSSGCAVDLEIEDREGRGDREDPEDLPEEEAVSTDNDHDKRNKGRGKKNKKKWIHSDD